MIATKIPPKGDGVDAESHDFAPPTYVPLVDYRT